MCDFIIIILIIPRDVQKYVEVHSRIWSLFFLMMKDYSVTVAVYKRLLRSSKNETRLEETVPGYAFRHETISLPDDFKKKMNNQVTFLRHLKSPWLYLHFFLHDRVWKVPNAHPRIPGSNEEATHGPETQNTSWHPRGPVGVWPNGSPDDANSGRAWR